jgi:phosphoglucosamine mutase
VSGSGGRRVRFGTDGVRGVANTEVTPEIALAIGRAAVAVGDGDRVLVGRDTRRSGVMLAQAVAAGVCAAGADAVLLDVVPTPAVAHGSARDGVVGVMISASHNPYGDNGIKLFAPGGRKLTDAEQHEVEDRIARHLDRGAGSLATDPTGAAVGTVRSDPGIVAGYADAVLAALEGRDLTGLRVVVDCANGSDSVLAPEVLRRAGAEVQVLAARPDGTNINDGCGSTHPDALQAAVVAAGADIGLALDGDADRLLAVDHEGGLVDGDQLMALCAGDLDDRGRLHERTLVVTVMSNLGLRRAMEARGIRVVETPVGDRHVLEAMARGGFTLGGEQSGHLVFGELSTTGDGLLSGVVVCDLVRRAGRPLGELAADAMTRLPQVLRNVRVGSPLPDVAERLAGPIAAVQERLGDDGRVLLRPSGTEPVVRVMAEATTESAAAAAVADLVAAVEALAG